MQNNITENIMGNVMSNIIHSQLIPLGLQPALWLDASDTSTITEINGSVSQWDDKSSNNNNATQGASSEQPTTGIRSLNGLNVIDFNDNTLRISALFRDNFNLPHTLFVVFASDNTQQREPLIQCQFGGTPTYVLYYKAYSATTFSAKSVSSSNNITHDTNTHIQRGKYDGLNITNAVDGVQISSVLAGEDASFSTNPLIGNVQFSTIFYDGCIAEILFFNKSLTTAETLKVEKYLANKWSVTI